MTEFLVKFFGVLSGVVARSLLPWLRKLRDNEIQSFDRRYLISAIASFIICFIITLLIFPHFTSPEGAGSWSAPAFSNPSASSDSPQTAIPSPNPSLEDYFKLFCLAFGFGFGFDGIIKEAGQWLRFYRRRYHQPPNPPSSS